LAFGYGLNDDIAGAYIFICRNFQPQDKLYLFGFSRGAYTVRAVASMLHMYGLVPSDNERLVPYAVRMMWAIRALQKRVKPTAAPDPRVEQYFGLASEFKATFSRECAPHFVGVWDIVSSIGWLSNPLSLPTPQVIPTSPSGATRSLLTNAGPSFEPTYGGRRPTPRKQARKT
jgi:uncharacterized protein (DUF2235 family)